MYLSAVEIVDRAERCVMLQVRETFSSAGLRMKRRGVIHEKIPGAFHVCLDSSQIADSEAKG
jgi:hypothetical protein